MDEECLDPEIEFMQDHESFPLWFKGQITIGWICLLELMGN